MPDQVAGRLRKLRLRGFKSILDLELELGVVNVFIGENGAGKSNILEAISFASAALADRLDHEFLASRGMRTPPARSVLCAFAPRSSQVEIEVDGPGRVHLRSEPGDPAAPDEWRTLVSLGEGPHDLTWQNQARVASMPSGSVGFTLGSEEERQLYSSPPESAGLMTGLPPPITLRFEGIRRARAGALQDFLLFAPETSALRTFEAEGQIRPLGIRGEGLFAHLKSLGESEPGRAVLVLLNEELALLDWFRGFELPPGLDPGERRMNLRDRFLNEGERLDSRSVNEGFLYLLFYFTLLLSPRTPRFFAIDNIDSSLNPRLCRRLMVELVRLAKDYERQVLVTTHNPAVLDGLDLNDDDQRLFVVYRSEEGATRVRRVPAPRKIEGAPTHPLSEAFMRGYLGGLPENF